MEQMCFDNGISDLGCNLISWGLYFSYFLFAIALISGIILPLIKSIQSPKELLKSAAGVVVLVVVFVVAYSISGDEVTLSTASYGVTPSSSKLIGGGLITLYIIFLVAVAGLVYSMVNSALKNN
ncbi:MAG: hypothetical protein JNN04_13715 [Cyclobacteriaceae bacterium]|nr:hypothetical protein [Cyclobacteriaceae bacterium]